MCAGIRRASGKAARRCLATFVGALLASLAGGWHAFVDFEASPDWPGTALTSNLQLTWLKRSNASCISGTLLHDGEARSVLPQNPSCEYYRQAPAEMCTTAEARNQCCECGGGFWPSSVASNGSRSTPVAMVNPSVTSRLALLNCVWACKYDE